MPPTSTYYNIKSEHCYELFNALDGTIIALIDNSNYANSICIQNNLFPTVGPIGSGLPLDNDIVIQILKHIKDVTPEQVSIIKVSDMTLLDRCDSVEDVRATIEQNIRNNKIGEILK